VQSRPPLSLKEQFANVLKAEIGRNKLLNEARSYENQVWSKATADFKSRINLAESDRARLVSEVSSRAEQFEELLPETGRAGVHQLVGDGPGLNGLACGLQSGFAIEPEDFTPADGRDPFAAVRLHRFLEALDGRQ